MRQWTIWIQDLGRQLLAQQNGAPPAGNQRSFLEGLWPLLILMFVVAYFMLLRPERKQRAKREAMLQALKKNDRVLTIGGIYGTIVSAPEGSEDVVVRVDDGANVRVRVQRTAVARVIDAKGESESKASPDKK